MVLVKSWFKSHFTNLIHGIFLVGKKILEHFQMGSVLWEICLLCFQIFMTLLSMQDLTIQTKFHLAASNCFLPFSPKF